MAKTLTETQQRLYNLMAKTPDTDVTIWRMYEALFQIKAYTVDQGVLVLGIPARTMQMRMGPTIKRINEKLKGQRIEPGALKQTYRLNTGI